METQPQRDTREAVDDEYHYMIFDALADSYNEGRITLDALKTIYHRDTGIEPRQADAKA